MLYTRNNGEKIWTVYELKARAKINLGLDVLGKRDDGYHEVRMIMQTVGIYDRIIIKKIPEDEIRINSNLFFLPVNENNLIYKAAQDDER